MTMDAIINTPLKGSAPKNGDSFFESREWKSWGACRRRKGEVWDERKILAAKLQRSMAACFRMQYLYFCLRETSDVRIATLEGDETVDIAGLEAEARADEEEGYSVRVLV